MAFLVNLIMKYKISIALTTYNSELYIKEQLESLINQSRSFDELVICDDNSTDDTPILVEDFILKHKLEGKIRFIKNDYNLGFVQNFKQCIGACSGNLIFLCDHDDIWERNKLEEVERIFINNDIYCLGHSFNTIDSDGNWLKNNSLIFWSNNGLIKRPIRKNALIKISPKDEFFYNFCPGCCIAFKNDLKKDILDSLNKAPHDYLIAFLYATKKNLYFYNKPLIKYRLHNNNAIGLPKVVNFETRKKLVLKDFSDKKELFDYVSIYLNKKEKRKIERILKMFLKRYNYFCEKKILKLLVLGLIGGFAFLLTILKDMKIIFKND